MIPNLIYCDFALLNLYMEIKQEIMLNNNNLKHSVVLKLLVPIWIPSNVSKQHECSLNHQFDRKCVFIYMN